MLGTRRGGSGRRRAWAAAVLGLWLLLGLGLVLTGAPLSPARARDDAASASAASAEPASAPAGGSGDSFLVLMWRRAGVIELVIGGMSFYLIALVVWMGLQYRRAVAAPEGLSRDVGDLLGQRRYSDAFQRLSADPSFLARVLAAGVRRLPAGQASALRAMELANDDVTMEMEHRTTYLATVGTLGPMIGLVGTVYGMILSFRVIALAGSSPQASDLARGISTALFATLEGIAISIPAIYFYAFFRNRIARLSLEVAIAAEGLLEQFAPGVRSSSIHPLAAAAVPATQPGPYPPAGPPPGRPVLPPGGAS